MSSPEDADDRKQEQRCAGPACPVRELMYSFHAPKLPPNCYRRITSISVVCHLNSTRSAARRISRRVSGGSAEAQRFAESSFSLRFSAFLCVKTGLALVAPSGSTPLQAVCHLPSAIGDWRLAIRSEAASLVVCFPSPQFYARQEKRIAGHPPPRRGLLVHSLMCWFQRSRMAF